MLEHEAFKLFMVAAEGEVSEGDFTSALRRAVEHVQEALPAHGGCTRKPSYTQAIPAALDLMLEWYNQGLEFQVDHTDLEDLCHFISGRCPGCVWAVLLCKLHKQRGAQ